MLPNSSVISDCDDSTTANLYRRGSIRPEENAFHKKVCIYFWHYLWKFQNYPLKIDNKAHIWGVGLASPNQIFPPSHPLEIFGSVFEDNPDKILLWGHSNLNSAIKYLLFVILC